MAETTPTWSFCMPDEGAAFPEDLVEAVWSWLRWGGSSTVCSEFARPRSKEQLRILVNSAYQASLRSEERRQVRFPPGNWSLQPAAIGAAAERIVPPSVAPSRPVNFGLGDLVQIAPCLYAVVW